MTPGPVQPLLQGLYFQALWFGDRVVHLITILFPLHRIQDENDINIYSQRICRLKTVFFLPLTGPAVWSADLGCTLCTKSCKFLLPQSSLSRARNRNLVVWFKSIYQCKIVMNWFNFQMKEKLCFFFFLLGAHWVFDHLSADGAWGEDGGEVLNPLLCPVMPSPTLSHHFVITFFAIFVTRGGYSASRLSTRVHH